MLPCLDELEADLHTRRDRARQEGWLGEIEGIDLTVTFLVQKREQARRHRHTTVLLGLPAKSGALEQPTPCRDPT
jgi:hypothetical protein